MDNTNANAKLPLGVLIALFLWALLAVLSLLDASTARIASAVIAGMIVGVTFSFMAWHHAHVVEGAAWMRLIGDHAIYAHVAYGLLILFLTALITGGRVYGMDYTANVFRAILGGSFLGVFLYLGLELDSNMVIGNEIEWFTLLFVGLLWILLFILFSGAGAFIFITVLLLTRILLSTALYRISPDFFDVIGWHRGAGHVLALNIMVLPLTAWIAGS